MSGKLICSAKPGRVRYDSSAIRTLSYYANNSEVFTDSYLAIKIFSSISPENNTLNYRGDNN